LFVWMRSSRGANMLSNSTVDKLKQLMTALERKQRVYYSTYWDVLVTFEFATVNKVTGELNLTAKGMAHYATFK
jgi:hypothetical protein